MTWLPVRAPFEDCVRLADLKPSFPEQISARSHFHDGFHGHDGLHGTADMTSLLDVVAGFKTARVLVVGDVMLDRFVYARVSRISPEAPVPVLAVERETATLGGAGNVARNIASLG